ncbi:ABC transporter ATP-binding protein [Sphingomonas sp. IC4-52]|uniref:ABC transporter ATP-binding protein n=1 Tax=Sphingomonas sp. IC4-52 TaxID=2887202 RepID=UPI001D12A928|nr:ABC transporter ATP-binding protein [Sphingomonas sp. IC4-52]MCC2981174.1 ABC transporter ATP-binding protein [Sphingomonas sp. IC4-52]
MTDAPLLSVRQLVKRFGEGEAAATVLYGIDLDLARGELAALLGPSGSGKSTLLTILGTLLQPTRGEHWMLGVDLATASEAEKTRFRAENIGFVFQFHHLLPDLTALENVMMPAAAQAGRETPAMRDRAGELLEAVGLAARRDYRPAAMSGGQRQRVAVARALMNRPALVLADEPTGNLDRESADQVMDLIGAINAQTGTCFLISTHDERISARCRRRIELLDGRLVMAGPMGGSEGGTLI